MAKSKIFPNEQLKASFLICRILNLKFVSYKIEFIITGRLIVEYCFGIEKPFFKHLGPDVN